MSTSRFKDVKPAPPIEVFALSQMANKDDHPHKVNLTVGAYRTEEGKPFVLPVVRKAEKQLVEDPALNKEYLPISGLADYCDAGVRLVLGNDCPAVTQNRTGAIQALGGTGAIRLGADFVNKQLGSTIVYVPTPTWGNHIGIFQAAGYEVRKYRYWDEPNRGLDFAGMMDDLKNAPANSVIVLHGVAHNPTGVDPTMDQWKQIADVLKKNSLFPFVDFAYQGFASGDVDIDAKAVRFLAGEGFEMCVAQSYSKNFGMYNERCGNLIYIVQDGKCLPAVKSQLELLVRRLWSNPPSHGARVIATILKNDKLNPEWRATVKEMAERIMLMRKSLFEKLKALGTPGSWNHITSQKGMFSFTGLTPAQVDYLKNESHVYLMKNGRVNMCGLTTKNVDYVASAIHEAITNCPDNAKL